jgi:hypothetical protein
MARRFLLVMAFMLACSPRPAAGDPFKPFDPFVGVRGEGGSIDSRIPGFQELVQEGCPVIPGASVFCQTFDIFQNQGVGSVINNITLAFTELGGFGLPSSFLSPDPSPFNEFNGAFVVEDDGFSVTLFFGSPISLFASSYLPGVPCQSSGYNSYKSPNCSLQVSLYPGPNEEVRDPYAVSIRAINGVTVDTTPIPAPVPEPATLVLLGVGLAGLAARQRRRHPR